MRAHALPAVLLFTVALAIRVWLQQGLVLGDDPQEYAVLLHILNAGPLWNDQLHLRFGGWIFNHLAFWLFGVSEQTFLLPTAVVTSVFPVLAYAILARWGYGRLRALLGGLVVATAPFEVMLGSLRANDSYLELAMAVGLAVLVFLEAFPVWQGLGLALVFWFGFYVKLWVVFALPALGLYYLLGRRWRAAVAFMVGSLAIHGATCAFWHSRLGTYTPFISSHAANYPVPREQLVELFLKYPKLVFEGSFEFPTTLWGWTPHVLVALLVVKTLATLLRRGPASLRLDRGDRILVVTWFSVFLFLEFFPAGFALDAYYSVPRIFRYLAPLSFPVALHAAKVLLDVAGAVPRVAAGTAAAALAVPVLALNVGQSVEATSPSHVYRENLQAVLADIRDLHPPVLVAEAILASYVRDLYLEPDELETQILILHAQHQVPTYERWLRGHEATLPEGAILVTGLASFVHYGAHLDGFRLEWFEKPLAPEWKLVREHGVLWYLPRPERARLWRYEPRNRPPSPPPDPREDLGPVAGIDDPATLMRLGMQRYEQDDYPGARPYLWKAAGAGAADAETAAFFYAASFFREANWLRARREMKRLLHRFPASRWTAAAQWHIAACDRYLGRTGRARRRFAYVARRFPADETTARMARRDLKALERRRGGVLVRWWHSLDEEDR
jgi:hypothetical protein